MDFSLPEEYKQLQELVEKFVQQQLVPLEPAYLAREISGEKPGLTTDESAVIDQQCKDLGLWGLDCPEQTGGADLPAIAMVGVNEELGRTVVPFHFPPDSPNLHMLLATANDYQMQRYVEPYARGEAISAIAISEPGAGADPAGMITKAVRDGDEWVLNGRKIWVSRVDEADFTILMAVTDPGKGNAGISAFIIEKDTPGFVVSRHIPMIGGHTTFEITLDNCRLPATQLLGELGKGFAPMQLRLVVRRLQMGAWCVGMARRAVDIICDYAKNRETFGQLLADRQAIQWWVADAEMKIHACRLMLQHAAWKQDQGEDVRTEASMVKVYGTELATDIIDQAMQTCGAMGMTKELPLNMMAQQVRTMRIFEGPSEVHRMVIARRRMR
ncbi:MAG: acyl-CoA dehydrogenase family protein [Oceanicoccus sp.]